MNDDDDGGATPRNRWWLVIAAGLAVFMAQVDVTVVHVALPTIGQEFGISAALTQWVVLGYVLPMVALSLPAGRWLDRMGRREAFVGALAGFAIASVAAGMAPNIWWLITARLIQGAFGAALFALLPVLATTAVRPQARGRAMSIVMTLGPLGAVSGPALGGVVIDAIGWPWIFYLNVPVSLLVIGIAVAQLPAGAAPRLPGREWVTEAAVLTGAAVAVLLALSLTADVGPSWLFLALAAVPFLLVWLRLPSSTQVRQLVRAPGMLTPHLALLAEMTAVMAVQFLAPFYLHQVGDLSPTTIGLTVLAFPAGVMLFGLIGGALADRWSPAPVAVAGTLGVTAGIVLLIPLGAGWEPVELAWRLAIAGAGAGLFAGQNQNMAMSRAPRHLLATTGATTSLVRQLGIALGPALTTVMWSIAGDGIDGMRLALVLAAVLAAVSVLVLVRRHADDEPGTEPRDSAQPAGAVGPRR
ncbi:MFS transporter [Phytoactinopolyspora halotolerans]|uniref:MFS transporter n=1 Tax=Phytoactinopolyspora halotolerans TaxID=1981512 RepID=A0A6L9S6X0_9ACTN|nr:MFS transporter [Phytoactinopolyspora halotolerans]NEE00906.1 MFS transporter [Phytoactinopolyspora halotolerans]